MKKKDKEIIDKLIQEGKSFSFKAMKRTGRYGSMESDGSTELIAWLTKVHHFIGTNYSEGSGPVKAFNRVEKGFVNGYSEGGFNEQLKLVLSAITACKDIEPDAKDEHHPILSLLKNIYFWGTLIVVIPGAYYFGYDNGNAKINELNLNLSNQLNRSTFIVDSLQRVININESKLIELQDSINSIKNPVHQN